jgi:hypothetical protein
MLLSRLGAPFAGAACVLRKRMLKALIPALLFAATPALAATPPDRATAISTLAALYYSADACNLSISRAKVADYSNAARPAGDPLFNVDVFRATHDLYAAQKDWTKDQVSAWCATEAATAKSLGMLL